MWKNTDMEEKHRQENDLRVGTPLIQQCIGCGGKSSLIKMKNSEAIWWFHYLRLHGKCMEKTKICKKNCMDAHVLWYTEVLVLSLQEHYLKERMFLSAKNTDAGCEIQTEKSGFASIRWSVVVSKRLPEGRKSLKESVKNMYEFRISVICNKKRSILELWKLCIWVLTLISDGAELLVCTQAALLNSI